jgi:hypothetical protein
MTDWPPVWVLFGTYKRTTCAVNTIESLHKYLKYPNLHYHICDDGSGTTDDGTDRWHVGVLSDAFAQWHPEVSWHEMQTPPGKFNTGGNINLGIQTAQNAGCQIHMLVFDDWALEREVDLDIRPHVDILDSRDDVGFIRLSYLTPGLGSVVVNYHSDRLNADHIWYLVSMQPYIAHLRFFNAYGYFMQNVNPGITETQKTTDYLRSPHGENGPQILHHIGLSISHSPWGHMVGRANDYAKI